MQASDDLRLGPVYGPATDFLSSGNPAPMERGVGPMGRTFLWDVVPLALNASNLATAQAATGGTVVLTAGAGVTLQFTNPDGIPRYVLDTPRAVSLTAAGANAATAIVRGFDAYGQPMSEAFAAPATSTVAGNKAFKVITSITFSGTPGSNVSAGTTDKLGIPYAVADIGYIQSVKYGQVLAQDAGTAVAAVTTDPATQSTGDVRGTYTPSIATNGSRRLVMSIGLPAIASGPQATRVGALGVTQA